MIPTLHFDPTCAYPVLTYDKDIKTFSIEASNLPDQDATPIRNYAHRSFYIYSAKTGVRKLFTLSRTHRDAEGDVRFWEYTCPAGFELWVFND